jgi:hypothetical protein
MKLLFASIWIVLFFRVSANASEDQAESCQPFADVALGIIEARGRFNTALRDSDTDAIRVVLAEKVILITGSDSAMIIGRDAQLEIWNQDFAADARLIYRRTPSCITMSDILPISMERGAWRGAIAGDAVNHISGEYSAKWRKVDGQWVIEAETYLTTNCGGSLCPEKKAE